MNPVVDMPSGDGVEVVDLIELQKQPAQELAGVDTDAGHGLNGLQQEALPETGLFAFGGFLL